VDSVRVQPVVTSRIIYHKTYFATTTFQCVWSIDIFLMIVVFNQTLTSVRKHLRKPVSCYVYLQLLLLLMSSLHCC